MQPRNEIVWIPSEQRADGCCAGSAAIDKAQCLSPGYYFVLPEVRLGRRKRGRDLTAPRAFGPFTSEAVARLMATSARALGLLEAEAIPRTGHLKPIRAERGEPSRLSGGCSLLPQLRRNTMPVLHCGASC